MLYVKHKQWILISLINVSASEHINTHAHKYWHAHAPTWTCTYSHMDMHILPHGHAHSHMDMHTLPHGHAHTPTWTHTHTNTSMPTAAKLLMRDHHMRWGWNSFSWAPGLVHCQRSFERLPSAATIFLPEPYFSADSLTTFMQPRMQSHAVTTACTIKLKLW